MANPSRKVLIGVIILLVALPAIVSIAEYAYRNKQFNKLMGEIDKRAVYSFTSTSGPLYQFDAVAGYSYVPNAKVKFAFYSSDNKFLRETTTVVNNMGHLAPRDYQYEKPPGEYRIACLGDSFTATPQNETQWPTALEELCNADGELKQLTGRSAFRALNFGLDGTGFVQWARVHEGKAKRYDPDLVIVSFIGNDILRDFMYRATIPIRSEIGEYSVMVASGGTPVDFTNRDARYGISISTDPQTLADPDRAAQIKREIYRRRVEALPWKGVRLDIVSKLLGLPSPIEPESIPNTMFADEEVALAASAAALREIVEAHPRVLVLFHPTIQECKTGQASPILEAFRAELKDIEIISMLDHLPLESGEEAINRWYNLPHDEHPSDYGCEIYARAVRDQVAEFLKRR